jgi:hypothetical protein
MLGMKVLEALPYLLSVISMSVKASAIIKCYHNHYTCGQKVWAKRGEWNGSVVWGECDNVTDKWRALIHGSCFCGLHGVNIFVRLRGISQVSLQRITGLITLVFCPLSSYWYIYKDNLHIASQRFTDITKSPHKIARWCYCSRKRCYILIMCIFFLHSCDRASWHVTVHRDNFLYNRTN